MEEYIEQYRKNGGYIKTLRKHIGHAPIITIGVGVIIENNNGEILQYNKEHNISYTPWGINQEQEKNIRR